MKIMSAALAAFATFVPGIAFAYSDPAVQAQQFIDAFDKDDIPAAAATMLPEGVTITDEVPPYLWQGATAFTDWARDLQANATAAGIADENVALGHATRREMVGTTAYVIIPATYSFTLHSRKMTEAAQITFVMKHASGGWKIAAWTWTGPVASPAP